MNTTTYRWSSGLVALLFACAALAQDAKRFGIPGHGNLVLEVPPEWRVQERSLSGPPTIELRIRGGDALNVQVTTVRMDPGKRAAITQNTLRERLQGTATTMLAESVETEVTMIPLRGRSARGYYYSLTDRKARNSAQEYKYLTQGNLLVGEELVLVFTILHREPDAPGKERALQMLAGAAHAADEPSAASPSRPDALQVSEAVGSYELAVPIGRLVMTIPKGRLTRASNPLGGSADHPRYFAFVDGTLNVSGWFEPAQKFTGIQSFWEKETSAWRRRGLPQPLEHSFTRLGNWDIVVYDMPVPSGSNPHVRAHWVQAGTWIDVHLSVTSVRPSVETRAELMSFLRSIQVRERDR